MLYVSLSQFINHKEVVRQISELDEEDFSLLQCAVGESGSYRELAEGASEVPLHIGLEPEDLQDVSVAEKLETLLERLRDARGRVSADSGTVSDVDSSVAGPEEDTQGKTTEKCALFDTLCVEASGSVEIPGESRDGEKGNKTASSRDLLERATHGGDVRDRDSCEKDHSSTDSNGKAVQYGRQRVPRQRGVLNQPKPKKMAEKSKVRVEEQKPKVTQAEVIVQATYNNRDNETRLSGPHLLVAEAQQPESEDSSSLAEGGPFITHWGKGRWKRSGNYSRDWNRKQYNSQAPPHNRQRYSNTQGFNRPRYFSKSTNPGNPTSDKYPPQNGHKKLQQQKGGESLGPQNGPSSLEREKSPSVQQGRNLSPRPKSSVSTTAASTGTAVQAPVLRKSPQPEKSQKKLSYASVAGCVNTTKAGANTSVADKVPAAVATSGAGNAAKQRDKDIAASFNFDEVVEFLWNGKLICYLTMWMQVTNAVVLH